MQPTHKQTRSSPPPPPGSQPNKAARTKKTNGPAAPPPSPSSASGCRPRGALPLHPPADHGGASPGGCRSPRRRGRAPRPRASPRSGASTAAGRAPELTNRGEQKVPIHGTMGWVKPRKGCASLNRQSDPWSKLGARNIDQPTCERIGEDHEMCQEIGGSGS